MQAFLEFEKANPLSFNLSYSLQSSTYLSLSFLFKWVVAKHKNAEPKHKFITQLLLPLLNIPIIPAI